MIGTLQLVLRSDWVAILSGLICVADIERPLGRVISPIDDPPLIAEFVVISPARRMLSPQAQLFLEAFEAEIARIQNVWAKTIPPVVYPSGARRRSAALVPIARRAASSKIGASFRFCIEDEFR